MNKTGIGWTDYTSNPLRYRDASGRDVWACVKVSPGCTNCYSAALAKRYGRGAEFNAGETDRLEPYLDSGELHRLQTSKALSGKRVFLCDMTDLFGRWVPVVFVARLLNVIAERPDVTWQILTKRPERMREVIDAWLPFNHGVPLPNLWLGTSIESQAVLDERIRPLLDIRAPIHFLSLEPVLSEIWFDAYGADWVIAGGESGPGYRPMAIPWLADIAEQCRGSQIPLYVKQDSGPRPGQQGRIPNDLWALKQFPVVAS